MQLNEKLEIQAKGFENELENIKADNERKLQVAKNSMQVAQNKWGFISQTDFGLHFKVSIGSGTVGKLFKIIGLALPSKGNTTPYRKYIENGTATSDETLGYPIVKWNYEKCVKRLDKWLEEKELTETFYSIEKEKDLMKYINSLYKDYVSNEFDYD